MRKWIKGALKTRRRRRGLGAHHVKSVRVEALHKGALRRHYRLPVGKKIPTAWLERDIHSSDPHLRGMAQFALNARRLSRRRHRYARSR